MSQSLALRSALLYAVLVVLTISIMVVMIFENQSELIAENAVLNSRLIGSGLSESLQDLDLDAPSAVDLSEVQLAELESYGVQRIVIYHEDGRYLTSLLPGQAATDAGGERLIQLHTAITTRDFQNRSYHHVLHRDKRRVDLYVPVMRPGGDSVVAVAEVFIGSVDTALSNLYRQALLVGLAILALHLFYAFYLIRELLIPLRTLMEATSEISRGNLEVRVTIVRRDELGRLAAAFNEMSVAVRAMRDEARRANPLTGLPGNLAISAEIDRRLERSESTAVLYVDLDNFKAYNDTYGFSRGDEAILYARDCLYTTATRLSNSFLGHEGGDDFVLIVDFDDWEETCKDVIARFDENRDQFYTDHDRRRGFIVAMDRKGKEQRFPLMSLSIAVVGNRYRSFTRHAELVQAAAQVKKIAKRDTHSSYALDQRGSSGEEAEDARHA